MKRSGNPVDRDSTLRIVVINGTEMRYDLTVDGLPDGDYEITVLDRNLEPLNGPTSATDTGVTSVTFTIDGYGMATIRQQ